MAEVEEAIRTTKENTEGAEELDTTELDEFLTVRHAQQGGQKTTEEIITDGAAAEWQFLKDIARADCRKEVDENKFEWAPYVPTTQTSYG